MRSKPKDRLVWTSWMLVALACAPIACSSLSPAEHYRAHQDGESLRLVLSEQIKPGDPQEAVRSLLGEKTYLSKSHREGLEVTIAAHPKDFPDGIKETDQVLFYPYDDQGLQPLIFRDGKLINHNPSRYIRPR